MMRVALHARLLEGKEVDYEAAHRVIPEDLLALLRRAGIHDWMIWRSGRDVFHIVDCDDFDRAVATMEGDPANREWQALMADYVEEPVRSPDAVASPGLGLVWSMADQVPGETDAATNRT
jgi:L-rhamnose mutarotase